MKFLVGILIFVISWAAVGSGMENAGIEMPQAYMTVGAMWGMLWVGFLSWAAD